MVLNINKRHTSTSTKKKVFSFDYDTHCTSLAHCNKIRNLRWYLIPNPHSLIMLLILFPSQLYILVSSSALTNPSLILYLPIFYDVYRKFTEESIKDVQEDFWYVWSKLRTKYDSKYDPISPRKLVWSIIDNLVSLQFSLPRIIINCLSNINL